MTKEEQFKEELKILVEKFGVEICLVDGLVNFFSIPEWENGKAINRIDFSCRYFDKTGE